MRNFAAKLHIPRKKGQEKGHNYYSYEVLEQAHDMVLQAQLAALLVHATTRLCHTVVLIGTGVLDVPSRVSDVDALLQAYAYHAGIYGHKHSDVPLVPHIFGNSPLFIVRRDRKSVV